MDESFAHRFYLFPSVTRTWEVVIEQAMKQLKGPSRMVHEHAILLLVGLFIGLEGYVTKNWPWD
jgi:hypothetical protein